MPAYVTKAAMEGGVAGGFAINLIRAKPFACTLSAEPEARLPYLSAVHDRQQGGHFTFSGNFGFVTLFLRQSHFSEIIL